jgi:hypothetical protein
VLAEIEMGEIEFASVQLRFGILAEYVDSSRIRQRKVLSHEVMPPEAGFVYSPSEEAHAQLLSRPEKYSIFTL